MPDELDAYLNPPKPRGSRKATGLQPELETHWSNLQRELSAAGVKPVVRSGFRTAEQQNRLHRAGRPTKGNDGYVNISPHQEGRALDIGNLGARGQRIVRDYAKRNSLHVPSDEPWHLAIPKQQKGELDSYLDPLDDYIDKSTQSSTPAPTPLKRFKRDPFAGLKAGVGGQQQPETVVAEGGYEQTEPQQPGVRRQRPAASMQARHPGIIERATEAIKPYVPGLTSLDTPAGIKLDAPRGLVRGLTLGAVGEPRPITRDDLLVDPDAEAKRDAAEMTGETIGGVVPYIGTAKMLGKIPALAKATRGAHIARNAATFGGVEAAREGINTIKTSESPQPKEIAISTGIGAAMGGIAGVSPSMKRQVVAFLAPQVAVDVARGTPLEQAVQSGLTNLGFALTSGARGKTVVKAPRIRELRARLEGEINARQTETQRQGVEAIESAAPTETNVSTRPVVDRRNAQAVSDIAGLPEQRSGTVESGTSTPQRFYHRDYGEVVRLEDQSGSRRGKTKVAEAINPDSIHYVKTAQLTGAGNQRMVPLKPEAKPETLRVEPTGRFLGTISRSGVVDAITDPRLKTSHGDVGLDYGEQWRYLPETKTVYWTEDAVPPAELRFAVENYLDRRGYSVADHSVFARFPTTQGLSRAQVPPKPETTFVEQGVEKPPSQGVDPRSMGREEYVDFYVKRAYEQMSGEPFPYKTAHEWSKANPEMYNSAAMNAYDVYDIARSQPKSDLDPYLDSLVQPAAISAAGKLPESPMEAAGPKPQPLPSGTVDYNGKRYTRNENGEWRRDDGRVVKGVVEEKLNEIQKQEGETSVEAAQTVLRAPDGDRGGIISPSPTESGKWRLTRFDSKGFSGHSEHNSRADALKSAQKEWRFTEPVSEKEFASLSSTEKFAAGNELTQFVNKKNLTSVDEQRITELNTTISSKPKIDLPNDVIEQHRAPYKGITYDFGLTDRQAGSPRGLENLRSWSTTQLEKESYEMLRASSDRLFGHNAAAAKKLVDKVLTERKLIETSELDSPPKGGQPLASDQVTTEAKTNQPIVSKATDEGAGRAKSNLASLSEPAKSTTAAKREAVTADRAERNLPPILKPERKADADLFDAAKTANAQDPMRPLRLADEVLRSPRALSDTETVQLDLRRQELKNEYDRALKEVAESSDPEVIKRRGAEADSIESESQRVEEAWAASGTEKGRSLRAQRIEIDQDFRLLTMVGKLTKDKGRKLNADERSRVDEQHRQIEELTVKLADAESRAAEAQLQKQIDKVVRRGRRAETKATLDEEFADLKTQFAQARAESRVQASGLAGLDPEGKLTPIIARMARNRVKAGTVKAEALVDEIYTAISEYVPEVTKRDVRDAISGYKLAQPDRQSELTRKLRDLRGELQSLSKVEDIGAGIRSPHREGPTKGMARQVPTEGPRKSEARSSGIPLEGPRRSDINKVPLQGPRQSEARQSGVPLQGPKLGDIRKVPVQGPRLSEASKSGQPLQGPHQSEAYRLRAEGPIRPVEGVSKRVFTRDANRRRFLEAEIKKLEAEMASGVFSETVKREPPRYTRETYEIQKRLDGIKQQYAKDRYKATRSTGGKISDELAKAANVPKTLKSIGDVSAVLRQGGFYSITHPIEGLIKPTREMMKSFSDRGWRNVEAEIKADSDFETLRKAGVEFTGVDKSDPRLSKHEEGYLGQEYLQYVPVAKQVANFSERTFVSFLDAQRLYIGKQMLRGLTETQRKNPAELKAIARLINTGTGRGSLGRKGNSIAPALNIAMFSPRLLASRVQLLNNMINPVTIARMPAGARKRMIADNVKFLAATMATIQLARMSGASISLDPDDAEFLKIRFGNTVYDQLTGLQQPMRFIINMTRAATGGDTYPGQDMAEQSKRFARSKLNPALSPAVNFAAGEDFMGRKFSATREARDLVVPLPANDVIEAMRQEGLIGLPKALPTFVGIGVGSYPPSPDRPTTHAEKLARKLVRERQKDKPREEEEMEADRDIAQARAKSRRGENVSADIAALKGKITKQQIRNILSARNKKRLEEDVKAFGIEEMVLVYQVADDDERKKLKPRLQSKIPLYYTLLPSRQQVVREKLNSFGIKVAAPRVSQ